MKINYNYNQFIESIKEVFEPVNLLIIILTVLFFMIVEIAFVWFIVSREVEKIIAEKSEILSNLRSHPDINNNIEEYIKNNYDSVKVNALKQLQLREEHNIKLYKDRFVTPIVFLIVLFVCVLLYMFYIKRKLTVSEYVLLLLIITSFILELFFYFIIIKGRKYITDSKIYELVL